MVEPGGLGIGEEGCARHSSLGNRGVRESTQDSPDRREKKGGSVSAVNDSVLAVLPFAAIAFVTRGSTPGVGGLGDIVTADMLREFATATVSVADELEPDMVVLEHRDGGEILVFEESGLVNEIALDPRTGAILARYIYGEESKLILSCEYTRYKLTGGVLRPYVINVSENGTGNSLEMVYEHQSLNGRVRDRDLIF